MVFLSLILEALYAVLVPCVVACMNLLAQRSKDDASICKASSKLISAATAKKFQPFQERIDRRVSPNLGAIN